MLGISFTLGLMAGACIGVVLVSLLVVGGRTNEE